MARMRKMAVGGGAGVYVALFRGINVGGNNMLPMAEVPALFAKAGCVEAQTYIQSGNVVFAAERECVETLPRVIAGLVAKRFGFSPVIVVRSAEELAAAARANPFGAADLRAGLVHIGFLEKIPDAQRIAALDPDRSPGDFFHLRGGHIYLKLAAGAGKTKLTNAWFDSKLATISTFRNWRTLLKLVEMTSELSE